MHSPADAPFSYKKIGFISWKPSIISQKMPILFSLFLASYYFFQNSDNYLIKVEPLSFFLIKHFFINPFLATQNGGQNLVFSSYLIGWEFFWTRGRYAALLIVYIWQISFCFDQNINYKVMNLFIQILHNNFLMQYDLNTTYKF